VLAVDAVGWGDGTSWNLRMAGPVAEGLSVWVWSAAHADAPAELTLGPDGWTGTFPLSWTETVQIAIGHEEDVVVIGLQGAPEIWLVTSGGERVPAVGRMSLEADAIQLTAQTGPAAEWEERIAATEARWPALAEPQRALAAALLARHHDDDAIAWAVSSEGQALPVLLRQASRYPSYAVDLVRTDTGALLEASGITAAGAVACDQDDGTFSCVVGATTRLPADQAEALVAGGFEVVDVDWRELPSGQARCLRADVGDDVFAAGTYCIDPAGRLAFIGLADGPSFTLVPDAAVDADEVFASLEHT
jgi:hypothetical protein